MSSTSATPSNIAGAVRTDLSQVTPFMIHGTDVSGRMIRLNAVADQILAAHPYPEVMRHQLAQMAGLAAGMAAAMKFDGKIIVQAKGDGAIPLLVADADSKGGVRAYGQWDDEKLAQFDDPMTAGIPALMGQGYIAFTIDQGSHTDRYQGVVPLAGENLGECMQHYFTQSDQLDMVVRLESAQRSDGLGMVVGCLLIQRLPDIGGEASKASYDEDASLESWRRAMAFVGSVKREELASDSLSEEQLLYRLFHEDGVQLMETKELYRTCGCSQERIRAVLSSLKADDFEHCFVEQADGRRVAVSTCEFCNTTYEFDRAAFELSEEGATVGQA